MSPNFEAYARSRNTNVSQNEKFKNKNYRIIIRKDKYGQRYVINKNLHIDGY